MLPWNSAFVSAECKAFPGGQAGGEHDAKKAFPKTGDCPFHAVRYPCVVIVLRMRPPFFDAHTSERPGPQRLLLYRVHRLQDAKGRRPEPMPIAKGHWMV